MNAAGIIIASVVSGGVLILAGTVIILSQIFRKLNRHYCRKLKGTQP